VALFLGLAGGFLVALLGVPVTMSSDSMA
jgi:hypothetical protein